MIIKTKEERTSNKKKQSKIIAKYFENTSKYFKILLFLYKRNTIGERITTPMSTLFISSEIRKAVWTLKNNKSPRMNQTNVELIRYSPEVIYEKMTCTTILQPQGTIQMKSRMGF